MPADLPCYKDRPNALERRRVSSSLVDLEFTAAEVSAEQGTGHRA